MRGKNKSMKRYLRKQRKNVIDPKAVSWFFLMRVLWRLMMCRLLCGRSWRSRGRSARRLSRQRMGWARSGSRLPLTASGGRHRYRLHRWRYHPLCFVFNSIYTLWMLVCGHK